MRQITVGPPHTPYVVRIYLLQKSHTPIHYASWPESLHRPEGRRYLTNVSGGFLQLQATDGHASVLLSPHTQSVIIRYLASIPHPSGNSEGSPEEEAVVQTHCSVLVSEVHSVLAVPEHWRHPVSLLLQERNSSPQGKQEGEDTLVSSPVSRSALVTQVRNPRV